jgi:hypothetical protein
MEFEEISTSLFKFKKDEERKYLEQKYGTKTSDYFPYYI